MKLIKITLGLIVIIVAAYLLKEKVLVSESTSERPNIIFLLSDDQYWDSFGFIDPVIKTPNCDKLAQEGLTFSNVFHVAPICQPSRASIMLGRYMGSHGASFAKPTNHTISKDEYLQSYPVKLREAGYFTGFIGKFGFAVSERKEKNIDYDENGRALVETQKVRGNQYMPTSYFDVWNGHPGQGAYDMYGEKGHLTKVNGDFAIDFIRQAKKEGKPFNLSISFKAAHGPFFKDYVADPQFAKWYENDSIPRVEDDSEAYFNLLPEVVKNRYRGVRNKEITTRYQEFMKVYYALISGVDDVVGRIRKELIAQGLDKNTIIIYTSDNGLLRGSKRLFGKDLLYEESLRAPLLVYNPMLKEEQHGKIVNQLISMIDLAPTILDLAGIELPSTMQGVSFKSLIDGRDEDIRDFIFAENNFVSFDKKSTENGELTEVEIKTMKAKGTVRCKAVRTKEYKYIRYHETEPLVEELWHIKSDPLETKNLAENPIYKKVLDDMRKICDMQIKINSKQFQQVLNPIKIMHK